MVETAARAPPVADSTFDMSKRRRRSEASEGELDEYPAKKKRADTKWTVPSALNQQVCLTLVCTK